MRVPLRDLDRAVSQEILHGDQVHSPMNEPGPERMAAIMEAEASDPSCRASRMEGTLDVLQGPARSGIGENIAIAAFRPFQVLENRKEVRIDGDDSILPALRSRYQDLPSQEIDIGPIELQDLPSSHAGIKCDDEDRTQVRWAGSEEPGFFLGR